MASRFCRDEEAKQLASEVVEVPSLPEVVEVSSSPEVVEVPPGGGASTTSQERTQEETGEEASCSGVSTHVSEVKVVLWLEMCKNWNYMLSLPS